MARAKKGLDVGYRLWPRQVALWAKTLLGLVDVRRHENDQLVLELLGLHPFEIRARGGTESPDRHARLPGDVIGRDFPELTLLEKLSGRVQNRLYGFRRPALLGSFPHEIKPFRSLEVRPGNLTECE